MASNANEAIWKGDFTEDLKERIIGFSDVLTYAEGFAHSVGSKLKLKEVEVYKRHQDGKTHCRVVYETTVDEGAYCLFPFASIFAFCEVLPVLTEACCHIACCKSSRSLSCG